MRIAIPLPKVDRMLVSRPAIDHALLYGLDPHWLEYLYHELPVLPFLAGLRMNERYVHDRPVPFIETDTGLRPGTGGRQEQQHHGNCEQPEHFLHHSPPTWLIGPP